MTHYYFRPKLITPEATRQNTTILMSPWPNTSFRDGFFPEMRKNIMQGAAENIAKLKQELKQSDDGILRDKGSQFVKAFETERGIVFPCGQDASFSSLPLVKFDAKRGILIPEPMHLPSSIPSTLYSFGDLNSKRMADERLEVLGLLLKNSFSAMVLSTDGVSNLSYFCKNAETLGAMFASLPADMAESKGSLSRFSRWFLWIRDLSYEFTPNKETIEISISMNKVFGSFVGGRIVPFPRFVLVGTWDKNELHKMFAHLGEGFFLFYLPPAHKRIPTVFDGIDWAEGTPLYSESNHIDLVVSYIWWKNLLLVYGWYYEQAKDFLDVIAASGVRIRTLPKAESDFFPACMEILPDKMVLVGNYPGTIEVLKQEGIDYIATKEPLTEHAKTGAGIHCFENECEPLLGA
ncbi:Uncharacterised protein [Candidatus Gugararchaeum adminiculabundum]|nr:Uncharacterised protein [Candidatus Gugararchaeum adminiculabundum]